MKFTDCIEIVGSKPTLYKGTKQYVSTGAVEEYFINEKSIEEYSYKERPSRADLVGKSGDILFAKMAETKKTLILDKETENYLFSTGFFAIRPKNGILTTKCLYYLLNSKNFLSQKDKNSSGATQKAITNAGLEKINVNIPLFSKQDQIVKQFDLLTDIIKKYQSQLKKLDSLIKSRFIEMFEGNKYPRIAISEMVEGKVPSAKKLFNKSDEIKYIDISSVDNKINEIVAYTEYIFENAPSRAQQYIRKNDILISTVRPNLKNIAINKLEYKETVASSGFCVLRPKYVSEYLFIAVLQDKFTSDMVAVTTGANYPAIKDSDILNYEISNPPLELQQQFATFVQQIDKSKFENTTQEIAA